METSTLKNLLRIIYLLLWGELYQGSLNCKNVLLYPLLKSEYIVVTEASKEFLWIKNFSRELLLNQETYNYNYDNRSVINLSRNAAYNSRTKHIDF